MFDYLINIDRKEAPYYVSQRETLQRYQFQKKGYYQLQVY